MPEWKRDDRKGSAAGGDGQKGGKSGEWAFVQATAKQMAIKCNQDVFPIEVMFGKDARGAQNMLKRPCNFVFLPSLFFLTKLRKSIKNLIRKTNKENSL